MILEIVLAILGLVVGALIGFFSGKAAVKKTSVQKIQDAENEAQQLLASAAAEAEQQKNDQLKEAQQKANKLREDANRYVSQARKKADDKNRKLNQREKNLNQQVSSFKKKEAEVEKVKITLTEQQAKVSGKQKDLSKREASIGKKAKELEQRQAKLETERVKALEKIANLTQEEAKQKLMDSMVKKAETNAMAFIKDIVAEAKMKANKEAKKIIIQTIQRTAAEHTIENTVSVFRLETDDIKGQIIGREGRNIRALEAETGVEIIVDDTPEAIVISGYDPVRREVARLSLHRLVTDGRIHPARIEEVVAKTRKQIEQQIVEIGERTVIELNIHGLHPELIKTVGRMRFRSSYGQNLLQHSIETAKICAIMAAELGLKPNSIKLAKRAGLLHDIGKVPNEETDLSHALLGMKWAEKYGEHPAVCNAIGAHHDEIEMTHLISPIIAACDAISGARPGARREILESYIKRIKELEALAQGYTGVDKAYAIQAGRELRVIVRSEDVTDDQADAISFKIAEKIQTEMQYPGQIKVTVIREKRAISFAR